MSRAITAGLFLSAIVIVYILWVVQPPVFDEWVLYPIKFSIPPNGQDYRNMIAMLTMGTPFSWFKPDVLIMDVLMVLSGWVILRKEPVISRFILTLLVVLGFPYLGTVATWSSSGSLGLSAAEMVVWFLFYLKFKDHDHFVASMAFFVLTFLATISHEVWLLSFSWVVLYVIWRGIRTKNRRDVANAVFIFLGYVLALKYYTIRGPQSFIDERSGTHGLFASLFTIKHFWKTLIFGTKENLLLVKDCMPVFFLVAYVGSKDYFKLLQNKIFIFLALGVLTFIYVNYFLVGPPHWRCRWLCAYGLGLASLSLQIKLKSTLRYMALGFACIWFIYNGIFTYYYTSIDVKSWLAFRSKVIHHNQEVLSENPYWGKQDNKFRYFWPTPVKIVRERILDYWKNP